MGRTRTSDSTRVLGPLALLGRRRRRPWSRRALRAAVAAAALGVVAPFPLVAVGPPAAATSAALAQSTEVPVSWSVRPAPMPGIDQRPNFVYEAEPGETIHDALVVENLGSVELVLGVYASDAFNTDEGGIDLLAAGAQASDVGRWVRPEQRAITVPAGGAVEVPFTVQVPEDATSGDHTGGIVTSLTVSEPDVAGNQVRIERRLGSRLHVRVDGELVPELSFIAFEIEHRPNANPFAPGSVVARYTVENTGNVRLRATRELRVDGSIGSTRISEGADMAELLPGNSLELTQEIGDVWPTFGTTVEVELRPYDAWGSSLDVLPRPVIARTSQTFLPLPQLVAVAVLVLMGALWWGGRQRRARQLEVAVQRAIAASEADLYSSNKHA